MVPVDSPRGRQLAMQAIAADEETAATPQIVVRSGALSRICLRCQQLGQATWRGGGNGSKIAGTVLIASGAIVLLVLPVMFGLLPGIVGVAMGVALWIYAATGREVCGHCGASMWDGRREALAWSPRCAMLQLARVSSVSMDEPTSMFCEVPLATADALLQELIAHLGERLWSGDGEQCSWIFRGQPDATWSLQPSAFRSGALDRYVSGQVTPINRRLLRLQERLDDELQFVMTFAAMADKAGFALPGDTPELRAEDRYAGDGTSFPPVRYRGLFALAQHYGVPTRMLDWTPRPLVAAYFAAAHAAERLCEYKTRRRFSPGWRPERIAVWALSGACLNGLAKGWDPGVVVVTAPAAQVPNLAAQRGCFTLVEIKRAAEAQSDPPDLDMLFRDKPLAGDQEARTVLWKFTIPAEEAGRLLYLLSHLDVDASSLFPGLSGVEQALFERALMPLPAFRSRG